jgi:hypothetical protein
MKLQYLKAYLYQSFLDALLFFLIAFKALINN